MPRLSIKYPFVRGVCVIRVGAAAILNIQDDMKQLYAGVTRQDFEKIRGARAWSCTNKLWTGEQLLRRVASHTLRDADVE